MRIGAVRRTVAGLLLGLLPVPVLASCGEEPKKHFPGAFPGTHTDVSAAQAFRDFDIVVPESTEVVGYYAWSEDDEYPMAAVLLMPCSEVSGFVSRSGLRPASSPHSALVGVQVFAGDHGWSEDDEDDRYLRVADGAVGVLVHPTGRECTVYLHT
ncbi:hypothetical protein ACF08N_07420 [Streptomyces sp. NPDC015127]|uniref:hypothetical protein n=1 Tax=Streptomyces sp. NPDC015127 TaxID=3364939 RepID=UPI0037017960